MKLGLASAIAIAAFGMAGCGGDSSSSKNKSESMGADSSAGIGAIVECVSSCTRSGFELPADAIYVSPDEVEL